MRRNTTQRDHDRNVLRRAKAGCHICGQPIDYALPHLDPMAFVADHVIPLEAGGVDRLSNKRAAHRSCNRAKGARLDGGPVLRRSGSLRPVGDPPGPGQPQHFSA